MKEYYMGLKNKAHRFCPECSSSILIDFQNSDVERQRGYLAINVRSSLMHAPPVCLGAIGNNTDDRAALPE